MDKHGSLLALFCFRRICRSIRDKTDLWIATRSTEWKPSRTIPFLCADPCSGIMPLARRTGHAESREDKPFPTRFARNAHKGFTRISGWIKTKKGGMENE